MENEKLAKEAFKERLEQAEKQNKELRGLLDIKGEVVESMDKLVESLKEE